MQASGSVELSTQDGLTFNTVGSYTSLSVNNQVGDDGCTTSYSGSMNGGITASVGSLSFAGSFLNGSSYGDGYFLTDPTYYFYESELYLPFRGTWSNGWYSTGTLGSDIVNVDGFVESFSTLNITTMTPEPSTLALFGTGVVPMILALRRKLLH